MTQPKLTRKQIEGMREIFAEGFPLVKKDAATSSKSTAVTSSDSFPSEEEAVANFFGTQSPGYWKRFLTAQERQSLRDRDELMAIALLRWLMAARGRG